ncbi:hypothetical protein [Nostoc sp.]|uniref:hypothetical protein n=1 Tax=Nostoc sp. TaxID=1180 RepID=UPI002FF645B8
MQTIITTAYFSPYRMCFWKKHCQHFDRTLEKEQWRISEILANAKNLRWASYEPIT